MVVTLGLTALFLAQGSTGLLGALLIDLDTTVAEAHGRSARMAAARATVNVKDPTTILRRNIFDSETGALDGTRVADVAAEDGTDDEAPLMADGRPPACDGAVRLVASLVNSRYPEWSFASIAGASGKALLYRQGGQIDGRDVVEIKPEAVYLRPSGGSVCTLAMFDPTRGATATAPVRPAVRAMRPEDDAEPDTSGSDSISAQDIESGITRVSDTRFTVARSLVDRLLENQAELMRTARIIPHQEGGRTVGVKLYGIRRNSLLGRLGLQNGDMLRTINGFDMTSPDSALEAYARLRGSDNLSVSIVRRGQPQTVDYNIQ